MCLVEFELSCESWHEQRWALSREGGSSAVHPCLRDVPENRLSSMPCCGQPLKDMDVEVTILFFFHLQLSTQSPSTPGWRLALFPGTWAASLGTGIRRAVAGWLQESVMLQSFSPVAPPEMGGESTSWLRGPWEPPWTVGR